MPSGRRTAALLLRRGAATAGGQPRPIAERKQGRSIMSMCVWRVCNGLGARALEPFLSQHTAAKRRRPDRESG
jgi:hypothetical protein